jgi:hypothetical protein
MLNARRKISLLSPQGMALVSPLSTLSQAGSSHGFNGTDISAGFAGAGKLGRAVVGMADADRAADAVIADAVELQVTVSIGQRLPRASVSATWFRGATASRTGARQG